MVASPDQMTSALDGVENLAKTTRTENDHIRMLKIMNDGTVEGRTAGMFEDYQGDTGNKGTTVFTQEELSRMVVEAAARQKAGEPQASVQPCASILLSWDLVA